MGCSRVEGDPVDTTVVTLEHKLNHGVSVTEHVGLLLVRARDLILKGHGCRSRVLLAQARNVPDANGLIKRGRDDQVILGMELGAHDVVVVTGHCANERTVLPIPYANGLVIGTRDDPWELVVEEDGADVVQMAVESEQATARLVGPDLNLVVVATRYEEGLCPVKVDASDGAIMLFEAIDQRTHAVVP
jgi:hypothetical protein